VVAMTWWERGSAGLGDEVVDGGSSCLRVTGITAAACVNQYLSAIHADHGSVS
jgi:hypothetical protein